MSNLLVFCVFECTIHRIQHKKTNSNQRDRYTAKAREHVQYT